MKTYISILRGINVGGHRSIKMEALKQLFADMGFGNIQTYVQSGNVIFQGNPAEAVILEQKIASKILETFGFDVPVIVLEVEELRQIVKNNPFIPDGKKEVSHLHVTFLSAKPDEIKTGKIKEGNYQPDEFHFCDKAIYLYCSNGYGQTKLTNNFFENKLKLVATTRNWKTTLVLLNMAEKMPCLG